MEFSLLTSHEGRAIPKLVAEEKIGNVSKKINDYKNYCFSPFNKEKDTSLYTELAILQCRKPRIKTIIFINVTFKRMFLLTRPHHNYFVVVVDATVITYFFIKLEHF